MNSTLNLPKSLTIFGIPVLIIAILVLIANSSFFPLNPDSLSIGITFDLLIIVPLVYFLLIRKTAIPKTTIILFLVLGMVDASVILPPQNQYYLELFKTWVFPLVELFVISFVIYKVSQAVKRYKSNQRSSVDFFTTLKNTCYEILPKAAVIPVVTEIAVFYYGFIDWKKRKLNENEFSYHRESATVSILITILFLVVIETFVFHLLLSQWSTIAASILTFLSIYSGFQLFGFMKSMFKRPILIQDEKLYLRFGIMSETTIELSKIKSLEISSRDLEFNKETRRLSILGDLDSHNVIIQLKEENTMTGLYGFKRTYKNLALHVDDKVRFGNKMNEAMQQVV
ncbi:hypothetical protein E4S40_05380 [Algoriphagus kandeliae]|uniref:Beta-carotene 15,15'-monooxygenase n=1 Tax=Algoriphagus kandeliae TaxID=2562278 RepID=A0A4Y9QWU3_9BACT|nr:hypothetical protein [Algoriphagus kandeliae]TFV95653.1 hypothetical protein E4S40_05380 [Algoriphagus kandeliae]